MGPDTMVLILPIIGMLIPIVAIIMAYFEKKARMEVVQKAIDKGVSIDGLKLDKAKARMPYRSGMVTLAVGLGLAIFGIFIGQQDSKALLPLVGIASILVLIGAALLLNDKMNYSRYFSKDDR